MINNPYLDEIIHTGAYLAASFVLFYIGKKAYQLFHPKINVKNELVEKDNFAFSIAHVGYFVGLILAIGSALVGNSYGLITDLIFMAVYGLLAILLLNLSTIITERFILNKFSVQKEIIDDQNAGTGVIEAAVAIASGSIIFGAVSGETELSLWYSVLLAIGFWTLGQVILIITGIIYNAILSYDLHAEIEKDNVAAGIGFAGALTAMGIIIGNGLSGDFIGIENFYKLGTEVLMGFILLPVSRFLSDKILLPGQKLTDEIVNQTNPNKGAALIEAFAYIGGSILITWCI